jgi:glycosyltransferase involved in cell wall biosynthesis
LLKFPLEGWTKLELKAKVKFWRDYGVKPIANSEWMAAMMRRSPLFEGMEIPVVPPIVDDIFTAKADSLKETLRRIADDGGLIADSAVGAKALDATSPPALDARRSTLDSPMPRWAGGSRFVVGFSARSLTDRGKGIQEFFARLPVDRAFVKETTFVLIGDGRILVPAGVDCRFPGHVDSPALLAEIYRSLDLFVSASAMETFGMAILEAQSCGTPVVVFETGGTPEAVCPAGSKLVRNRDWAGLFREVEEMFDRAVKGGGKNHALSDWVASRYSCQKIVEKQIMVYTHI